ncbi:NAD(P)-binding protein [Rhizodiscina lignyota]|uniref:NAD(P)-binding protein n=1 Tax=Rhizodiscina lignyota TaxID=1504668 RepID=A0A9P4M9M8_9PEZI|nr:NAD(P)-binding protein [Rhizodiscina lignyota]
MGETFSKLLDHTYYIPPPAFIPAHLPDQSGRVHIVTGGYTGIGLQLVKHLYEKNAFVYILGRSGEKADTAISSLRKSLPNSSGRLEFIPCDLADLANVKSAAQEFKRREQRLDVLTNNAGVMIPPKASATAQGHDMQVGVNCLAHFALILCLLPVLQRTAAASPPGSVRVTWASSMAVTVGAPRGGMVWDANSGAPDTSNSLRNYMQSKVGMLYLAVEMSRRYGTNSDKESIVSVSWDPGNVVSDLGRHIHWLVYWFMLKTYLYPLEMGAYSPLFAGWSEEVIDMEKGSKGDWVIPWGRLADVRSDIKVHLKRQSDGGGGDAERFWNWCEKMTSDFV